MSNFLFKIIAILLAFSCSLLYAQIDSQYKHKVEPLLLLMYESDINPAVKVDVDNIVAKTVNMSLVEKEIAVYDINGSKWFDGFVVGSINSQELVQLGISVGSQLDSFFTVSVPFSVLPALVSSSEVSYVEIAKGCKAELDVSSEAVKAARARDANDLTGQGIIIGIVDTGIDISQPDFRDENNQTRILKIWDQDDNTGPPPFGFNYGTEWSSGQINNGSCTQQDLLGHGTGVSGIVAGNGRATGNAVPAHTYVGMAPEADLILVHFLRLPGTNSTNSASVIDGINYIIAQALAANKPWVVNLSLGTRFGPKDGTSIFEQFLTYRAGK